MQPPVSLDACVYTLGISSKCKGRTWTHRRCPNESAPESDQRDRVFLYAHRLRILFWEYSLPSRALGPPWLRSTWSSPPARDIARTRRAHQVGGRLVAPLLRECSSRKPCLGRGRWTGLVSHRIYYGHSTLSFDCYECTMTTLCLVPGYTVRPY